MTTTLIITTYNWPEALELSVNSALKQTTLPDEIVIADDGSTKETTDLIERLSAKSPVPIVHVWHPDEGFRLTAIRNRAIAKATGEYIIQIDGDIILERHFIKDHIEMAERGYFVCGSRVRLIPEKSVELLDGKDELRLGLFTSDSRYMFNTLRSRLLRRYLAKRYQKNNIMRLRGCNMAFWRVDLWTVNGYNEALTSWGHEDSELAYRLINSGVKKKFLKMGGIAYHIYHKESSKYNEDVHYEAIESVKNNKTIRAEIGVDQYL